MARWGVPVISADFEARAAVLVMPWFADTSVEGHQTPRNLENRIASFLGDSSWPIVLELAKVLAILHDWQVVHGNLKSGNVFFDDIERVILSDCALGNMPGVSHVDFTGAYLYQTP